MGLAKSVVGQGRMFPPCQHVQEQLHVSPGTDTDLTAMSKWLGVQPRLVSPFEAPHALPELMQVYRGCDRLEWHMSCCYNAV